MHQQSTRKNLLTVAASAALVVAEWNAGSQAATLGTYRFQGADPSGDADVPTSTTLAFTAFTRTNVSFVSTNNVFNSSAWNTAGSIDTNEYAAFTVTPVTGYRLLAQSLTFTHARSTGANGGPTAGEVRHSNNAFASAGGAYTPSNTTTWNYTDFSTTANTEFRFYGWGASNASGTLSFDDVTLTGDTQARASLQTSIDIPSPTRVIVGASNVRSRVLVTNNALAAGTVASEGLDYSLALSGATGMSLGSPGNGSGLGASNSAMHFVDVDTSAAGTKSASLTVSSTNAFRANGTVGASSASPTLSSVDVLDHANASFAGDSDANSILLDFGTVQQNSAQSLPFSLSNLLATAGFTAGLDLDSILESGDVSNVFSTDLATFAALAAGGSVTKNVTLDTTNTGSYSASYTLGLSDEDIPGATGGQTLTINVVGNVVPEPTSFGLLAGGAALLAGRRRRR
jgi:hypothetical protein